MTMSSCLVQDIAAALYSLTLQIIAIVEVFKELRFVPFKMMISCYKTYFNLFQFHPI